MKMYIWNSKYMSNYRFGYIIVMAEGITEARKKALEQFSIHDKENYKYQYDEMTDEDNCKDIEKRTELFLEDINKQPEIQDVLFISGSE